MIYKLSQTASEDLDRIYSYGIGTFGLRQANIYFDQLIASFELIAENPLSFPLIQIQNEYYHKCSCGSDTIYYEIMEHHIEIVTIIGSQDFQNFE